jgi:dopamine beta-monooxygenase
LVFQKYTFPKEAGLPFYPTDGADKRYFLMEWHYDNPNLLPDIVDNSAIKLYFTQKELRPNDLGLLRLTDDNTIGIQVPPKANNFQLTTICYPGCTNQFFPDDGINAVAGFLHTHLAGRAVRTSLIRNNTLIEYLFDEPNYDSNYQFIQEIKPTKLYKGDVLITSCTYNTMDRTNMTFVIKPHSLRSLRKNF